MDPERRSLDWCALDPFLVGPVGPPPGGIARPFQVPAGPARRYRLGRLVSGPAWPAPLPAFDRVAAVPEGGDAPDLAAGAAEAVLRFESRDAPTRTLCARSPGGEIRWGVDPAAWLRGLLAEAYVRGWQRPLVSRLPGVNYARIPHAIKAVLQRLQSPAAGYGSAPGGFPSVPLDDLADRLRALCLALACDLPPTPPDLWPGPTRAALVLSHDVDTAWILEPGQAPLLREIVQAEAALGFRGAWYVTADRLKRPRHDAALQVLQEAGHEIGAHGWNHDARLQYLGEASQRRRVERIRERFEGLPLEGIRTPWYARSEALFGALEGSFRYDSSVPNASGFFSSGTGSGCCTLFPFRPAGAAASLLELPMTLPPDTALDPERGYADLLATARAILDRGGVAVVTLHPQPHQSARRGELERYFDFLRRLDRACGERVWRATPADVIRHYREVVGGRRASG